MPPSAAATRLQTMASPMTMPRPGTLNQTIGGDAGDDGESRAVEQPDHAARAGSRAGHWRRSSSRVASARTATVMVCVVALPPWLATIGASTASATIFCNCPSNRPSTEEARNAVARLTSSQLKRPRAMVHTVSDNSSSCADAAERLDVLFRLLLDDVGDVVEGDDADQPVAGVHHRRGHQIVALE